MKVEKNIIIFVFSILLLFSVTTYTFLLYGLPKILNSSETIQSIENFLSKKVGNEVRIYDFKFSINHFLTIDLKADEISSIKNGKEIVEIKNIQYKSNIFDLRKAELNSNRIYIDFEQIKKTSHKKQPKKKFKFNKNIIPQLNIKNTYIRIDNETHIEIEKIESQISKGRTEINILGKIKTPLTQQDIVIGEDGNILLTDSPNLNNFSIKLKNSKLFLNSDNEKNNLYITAKNLPADELKGAFLYSYRIRHPEKKNFLENFYDLNGKIDVNLKYNNDGFFGTCTAKDMKALFWDYKIPVDLPNTIFYFDKRIVKADTQGYFGPEPTQTDFYLTGIATKDLDVYGNVYSKFTDKITSKYFPAAKIKGYANATVKYHVKDSVVDIDYILGVNQGNNITSSYGNLDNIDKNRVITAHTKKIDDDIDLTTSKYIIGNRIIFDVTGHFEKNNGKYGPTYFHAKTKEKIPVAFIKSFLKDYIDKGLFDADVELFVKEKTLKGFINFDDIKHSDFLFLKNTNIKFENKKLLFRAHGKFFNSPISAFAQAENNFSKGIHIEKIYIHLNKYILEKGKKPSEKLNVKNAKQEYSYKKPPNVSVDDGHLIVDNINHEDFDLYNVEILGSLKNNIAKFSVPETPYAGGILSAKGEYNVYTHSSDINFSAKNVNSNIVVTRLFNLPNQVEGLAHATLHLVTKNKLNNIWAKATFGIDNGYLPKIGNRQFIINRRRKKGFIHKAAREFKFTLSKITNIDFNKHEKHYSNLYGSFILDNNILKDIDIYTKNDYVSTFIEGNYNIDTGEANLTVWGRHNKTEIKNIRIFKIPINWIYRIVFKKEKTADLYQDKISKIPPVKSKLTDMISIFRISICGTINDKTKKPVVILKDLR